VPRHPEGFDRTLSGMRRRERMDGIVEQDPGSVLYSAHAVEAQGPFPLGSTQELDVLPILDTLDHELDWLVSAQVRIQVEDPLWVALEVSLALTGAFNRDPSWSTHTAYERIPISDQAGGIFNQAWWEVPMPPVVISDIDPDAPIELEATVGAIGGSAGTWSVLRGNVMFLKVDGPADPRGA
jgi:hypothetical protein